MTDWSGWIDNLLELALSIGEFISQGAYAIVICLFYPLQVSFYWITSILGAMWNPFIDFFGAFAVINSTLFNHVTSSITSMLPSAWTLIIILGLTIVFTLRLYYFVKDISILGFKV